MGRHAGIYGSGQGGSLVLGLVSLAVLTRFLEPAAFGEYAIYYVFSALLAMLYTLGWVRGSLIWVFGGKGGDEDDDDDDDEEEDDRPVDEAATAEDKRAALGTAIVFIALIAAAGTAIVAALAPALGDLVTGGEGDASLTLVAAAGGAAGAVWILASAVPRRERRPKTFVFAMLSRPILVLAVTVPLVAVNPTVEAAVLGLAIGTAASTLVSLMAIRQSFRLTLKAEHVREIAKQGLQYAPLIVSLFVIANGGVILLSQYESASDVGLFRVATGVAGIAALPLAAFVTAWGPLRREPIYGAVEAERGKLAASGVLATYFVLIVIGILLFLAVGADLLVRVAPGAYADAAPLIPIVGCGLLMYGLLRIMRRSAKFPRKSTWYISLAVLAAVVFVTSCLLLIPPFGIYGAALGIVAGFGSAVIGITARSQLGENPIPFAYGRILGGLVIAAACFAAAKLLPATGPAGPIVDVAAILAYPLLLVVTGLVPRAHVMPIRRVARAALPGKSPTANGRVELAGLDDVQLAVLEILVRHRRAVRDVAPVIGVPVVALEASFVEALREVAGVKAVSAPDPRVGAYLLSSAPIAARDLLWRRLASDEGVDALEIDALSLTLKRLRRAPEATWRRP